MSSRPEGKPEVARAVADSREAAREITHSRTDRARVLGEGERERLLRDDDAHVEQQAAQQGGRFLGVGVTGDTVGPELAEYIDSGAGMTEETEGSAAAGIVPRAEEDAATVKAREGRVPGGSGAEIVK